MAKLFGEEQKVLDGLLLEWYESIQRVTEEMNNIFGDKGKMYDRESPVWERIRFPHGFVQELRKKTDRLRQLLSGYVDGSLEGVNWGMRDGVLEELVDIANYARMLGGLIIMLQKREGSDERS